MGAVSLTVADSRRRRLLPGGPGPARHARPTAGVLGAEPGAPLGRAGGRADAPARPQRSTGLFHLAILVPDRAELARALRRVVARRLAVHRRLGPPGERGALPDDPRATASRSTATARARSGAATPPARSRWPRCRSTWRACSASCSERRRPTRGMPHGTRMGHVHLQVRDLADGRGASTRRRSASTSTVRGYRARCSSRRAATTTTSASTPGHAGAPPAAGRAGPAGLPGGGAEAPPRCRAWPAGRRRGASRRARRTMGCGPRTRRATG